MRFLIVLLAGLALAADPPKPALSDAQKLAIRDVQVKKQALELRMSELVQKFQGMQKQDEQLAAELAGKVKAATPDGYELDLATMALKPKPAKNPDAKAEKPAPK